jgi:hypothetical protein
LSKRVSQIRQHSYLQVRPWLMAFWRYTKVAGRWFRYGIEKVRAKSPYGRR